MRSPKLPRIPERVEQTHIVGILRTLGATVYTLGTTRKRGDHPGTMQTAGLPDLLAFLPARSGCFERLLVVEVKARDGRLSVEQRNFRDRCLGANVDYVSGSLDDVLRWLVAERYLRADRVPHYRQESTP